MFATVKLGPQNIPWGPPCLPSLPSCSGLGYVLDIQRKHCIWYTMVCMYIYKDHILYFIKSKMPSVVSDTIFMYPEKRKALPIKLGHTTDHKVNLNFRNVKMCISALTKCGCTR